MDSPDNPQSTPETPGHEPTEQTESGGNGRRRAFPVVGIGASAGGLEAVSGLLRGLPPDPGMAFIVVPHLDPKRESNFAEILGRQTSMSVVEIEEDMEVEINHIYVIPPNCDCQGRSKTRPVGRSKSRPLAGMKLLVFRGRRGAGA